MILQTDLKNMLANMCLQSCNSKGDTAIGYNEHETTKQENDKLNKFKHSSKTTGLIQIL